MQCINCGEFLIDYLEEVLIVTVERRTRITGIEWESDDGEVLFDYDSSPLGMTEEDIDCDAPTSYQCGCCGKEYDKKTVVEILKKEEKT